MSSKLLSFPASTTPTAGTVVVTDLFKLRPRPRMYAERPINKEGNVQRQAERRQEEHERPPLAIGVFRLAKMATTPSPLPPCTYMDLRPWCLSR